MPNRLARAASLVTGALGANEAMDRFPAKYPGKG